MSLLDGGKRILKEAFPFILIINALMLLLSPLNKMAERPETSELIAKDTFDIGTLFLTLFISIIFLCKFTIYCGITLKLYREQNTKILDILPINKIILKSLKILWFVIPSFLYSAILIAPLAFFSGIIASIINPELSKIVSLIVVAISVIYLMFKFFFIAHIAVFNNKGFLKSLKESSSLMKGKKFAFLKAYSAVFLTSFGIGFLFSFIISFLNLDKGGVVIFSNIIGNLVDDISIILTCVIMLNLAREERFIEEYN